MYDKLLLLIFHFLLNEIINNLKNESFENIIRFLTRKTLLFVIFYLLLEIITFEK